LRLSVANHGKSTKVTSSQNDCETAHSLNIWPAYQLQTKH